MTYKTQISSPGKWTLIKGIVLAMLIRAGLKLSSFKIVINFIKRFEGQAPTAEPNPEAINRYRMLIISAHKKRRYFFINCLDITVAFWLLMKRKGIQTDLRFGSSIENGTLKAHSWLEYKGSPLTLNADIRSQYTAFDQAII